MQCRDKQNIYKHYYIWNFLPSVILYINLQVHLYILDITIITFASLYPGDFKIFNVPPSRLTYVLLDAFKE